MKKKINFFFNYFKFKGVGNTFKSFYLTSFFGILIIFIFFITPKIIVVKNNFLTKQVEVKNESKNTLNKVLKIKKKKI